MNLSTTLQNRIERLAEAEGSLPEAWLNGLIDFYEETIPWKAAFFATPMSSVIVDAQAADFPILAVNHAFEVRTGFSAEEAVGQNCRFLQGEDRNQDARKIIREALESKTPCQVQLRNYHKQGQLFWNELHIAPIQNDTGQVTHFIANQKDITDEVMYQEQLEASEEKYRQFVEAANEGIWAIDLEGHTTFVNSQMASMLGYTVDEMQELMVWDVIHQEDRTLAELKLDTRRQGHSEQHDFRLIHKDGSDVWVLINTNPLSNSQGKIYGAVGFVSDITRRVEAEKALAKREDMYKKVSELMYDYAFSINVGEDGKLYNDWVIGAYEEIVGMPVPEHGTLVSLDTIHPDYLDTVRDAIRSLLNNRAVTSIYQLIHGDGEPIWVEISRQPVWDEKLGRVISFYGAARNVTEQIQANLELRESEQRFRTISQMTSNYAFSMTVNADGTLKRDWITGSSMERITGFTPEESEARGGWSALAHPDDLPKIRESLVRLLKEPSYTSTVYRIMTKSGDVRYMRGLNQSIADNSGKIVKILGSAQDITDEYIAQQQLAASESRFRTMANTAPILIWMLDTDKEASYFNKVWLDFTGRRIEEELGLGWAEGIHPEDSERCLATCSTAFKAREPFQMEYRLRRHDGIYRWVRDDGVPLFLADGTFEGFIGSCIDITLQRETKQELERQVAEQTAELMAEIGRRIEADFELKRERDLLENTMRMSPNAIFILKTNGEIKFVSSAGEQLLGMSTEEVMRQDIASPIWHLRDENGEIFKAGEAPFEKCIATGAILYDQKISFVDSNNERRWLSLNLAPLFDENGEIVEVITTAYDMTLRKVWEDQMQAALAEEQRLNRIRSRFISTVTHEFKTPLTVIQTSVALMRQTFDTANKEEVMKRIERIEKQGKRLNSLVENVVQLNRTSDGNYVVACVPVDLNASIRRIVEDVLFAYQDKVNVALDLQVTNSLLLDEMLIYQVLSNLISNAVKYTPQDKQVRIRAVVEGKMLTVQIQDEGIGIPEADIPHLFNDFYRAGNTTNIEGTGLGLAIVKRAVSLHGGDIAVESIEGQGTTMTVQIPILE